MKISTNTIFTLLLLAFVLLIVVTAVGYPIRGSFGPLTIGILAAILLIVVLIRENIPRLKQGHDKEKTDAGVTVSRREYVKITAWMGGMLVSIYLFGMAITFPLFVFAYLKVNRRSWLLSISLAAGTFAVLYGVFELALKAQLYQGILLS